MATDCAAVTLGWVRGLFQENTVTAQTRGRCWVVSFHAGFDGRKYGKGMTFSAVASKAVGCGDEIDIGLVAIRFMTLRTVAGKGRV